MPRFFGLGNVHTPEELEELREQEEAFIKDKNNISNIPTLKNYDDSNLNQLRQESRQIFRNALRRLPYDRKRENVVSKLINEYLNQIRDRLYQDSQGSFKISNLSSRAKYLYIFVNLYEQIGKEPITKEQLDFLVKNRIITGRDGFRYIKACSWDTSGNDISFRISALDSKSYSIRLPPFFENLIIENPIFMLDPMNIISLVGFTIEKYLNVGETFGQFTQ